VVTRDSRQVTFSTNLTGRYNLWKVAAAGAVDAKYYPQEGHGFARRENQIDAARRTIDWFDSI
jgi:hypothetical protein